MVSKTLEYCQSELQKAKEKAERIQEKNQTLRNEINQVFELDIIIVLFDCNWAKKREERNENIYHGFAKK